MTAKTIVVGSLVTILAGALVVGALDARPTGTASEQNEAQTQTLAAGRGQPQGNGNLGQGQGPDNADQNAENNATPGTPQPQANVGDWLTLSGSIEAVEMNGLSVVTDAGEPLWVQLGQSRYWQSQDVTFSAGDRVSITGFYEDGQFQAGSVTNETTRQTLTLRDANGRPMWAGGPNH